MSLLPRPVKPLTFPPVFTLTANRTVRASENGAKFIFNSATSLIAILPPAQKGLEYIFYVQTPAGSGVGHLVQVSGSTSKMYGKVSPTGAAIAEAAGKGIVGTQATETKGDTFRVFSDGVDWFAQIIAGTFAREA